ncbi:steroid 17-alpha-hydroxylase/17,20 lyase-like [Haemaphysalis longicornis]
MSLSATFIAWGWRMVTTTVIFLATFYVIRFYHKVSQYPKGPFPLPVIGNLLAIDREKELHTKAVTWSKAYGDPFTLWMGSNPVIVLNSYDVIKEALTEKRHQFSGRPPTKIADVQRHSDSDIVFEDYNPTWKAIRKVALTAVRKYTVGTSLEKLCTEVVDAYVDTLGDNPVQVDARDPFMFIMVNILAMCAFGAKFHSGSSDLARIKAINHAYIELAPNGLPSDIAPWLGIIYYVREKKYKELSGKMSRIINRLNKDAKKSYVSGKAQNFTHAVLSAREEALMQEKSDAEFLTEGNMVQILVDLFVWRQAGTDTSVGELQWLLLKISREPSIQSKIQKEVDAHIGQSPPTMKDRERLPYTVACILETLRFYPITPLGLPHKASCDSQLGGMPIPKDTRLLYNVYSVNHDPLLWDDPEVFRPERFLDPATGKLRARDLTPPLLSFGLGPRSCPGEKLAHADMFFVLVRLVQRIRVTAPDGMVGADVKPLRSNLFLLAGRQEIILNKRR